MNAVDKAIFEKARRLTKTPPELLAEHADISCEKYIAFEGGFSELSKIERELILRELEARGIFFTFQDDCLKDAHLVASSGWWQAPDNKQQEAEAFSCDARAFLFASRAILPITEKKYVPRIGSGWSALSLPTVMLCCQSIELALKSFLIHENHEPPRTHDLEALLGKCKSLGVERILRLTDEENQTLKSLTPIHLSAAARYREIKASPVHFFAPEVFCLSHRVCRFAKPQLITSFPHAGDISVMLYVAAGSGAPTPSGAKEDQGCPLTHPSSAPK